MNERVGYVWLVGSVWLNAASYHLQRHAMDLGATKGMTVVVNCFLAASYFVAAGMLWRALGWQAGMVHEVSVLGMWRWMRHKPGPVLLATVLGAGAAYLIAMSVKHYGPETTAFLGNQTIVFMVLGGLFFGERVRPVEALVMLAILTGALLFSYQGGTLQLGAWALMASACLGVAGKQLSVRRAADQTPLPLVMAAMLLSMGVCSVVITLWRGELAVVPQKAMVVLMISTLSGSVLGMLLLYAGMGMVGVCRGSPVDGMRPLAVLIIGWMLGHAWPSLVQAVGAVLVLGGTAALARLHRPGNWRPESSAVTTPASARGY